MSYSLLICATALLEEVEALHIKAARQIHKLSSKPTDHSILQTANWPRKETKRKKHLVICLK